MHTLNIRELSYICEVESVGKLESSFCVQTESVIESKPFHNASASPLYIHCCVHSESVI